MNKFAYEMPEIKFELIDEDIITNSFEESDIIHGEEITPEQ